MTLPHQTNRDVNIHVDGDSGNGEDTCKKLVGTNYDGVARYDGVASYVTSALNIDVQELSHLPHRNVSFYV